MIVSYVDNFVVFDSFVSHLSYEKIHIFLRKQKYLFLISEMVLVLSEKGPDSCCWYLWLKYFPLWNKHVLLKIDESKNIFFCIKLSFIEMISIFWHVSTGNFDSVIIIIWDLALYIGYWIIIINKTLISIIICIVIILEPFTS